MDLNDIQKFIETDYLEWNKHFKNQEKQTEAFVIMMKISEESGELARELAKSFGFASPHKMQMPSKLESELADVIINTLLLARCVNIDVKQALERKMEMIRERIKGCDEKHGTCDSDCGCGK